MSEKIIPVVKAEEEAAEEEDLVDPQQELRATNEHGFNLLEGV